MFSFRSKTQNDDYNCFFDEKTCLKNFNFLLLSRGKIFHVKFCNWTKTCQIPPWCTVMELITLPVKKDGWLVAKLNLEMHIGGRGISHKFLLFSFIAETEAFRCIHMDRTHKKVWFILQHMKNPKSSQLICLYFHLFLNFT